MPSAQGQGMKQLVAKSIDNPAEGKSRLCIDVPLQTQTFSPGNMK